MNSVNCRLRETSHGAGMSPCNLAKVMKAFNRKDQYLRDSSYLEVGRKQMPPPDSEADDTWRHQSIPWNQFPAKATLIRYVYLGPFWRKWRLSHFKLDRNNFSQLGSGLHEILPRHLAARVCTKRNQRFHGTWLLEKNHMYKTHPNLTGQQKVALFIWFYLFIHLTSLHEA